MLLQFLYNVGSVRAVSFIVVIFFFLACWPLACSCCWPPTGPDALNPSISSGRGSPNLNLISAPSSPSSSCAQWRAGRGQCEETFELVADAAAADTDTDRAAWQVHDKCIRAENIFPFTPISRPLLSLCRSPFWLHLPLLYFFFIIMHIVNDLMSFNWVRNEFNW